MLVMIRDSFANQPVLFVYCVCTLFTCLCRSRHTRKLHTLTVKENPSAFHEFESSGKNATEIELKAMEKKDEGTACVLNRPHTA